METSIVSCVPTNQKPWRGPPSSQKMDKLLISFLFFSLVARMRWQPASSHFSFISQEAYKNWFLNYHSTQERDGVVEQMTSWKCSADQFYLVTSLTLSIVKQELSRIQFLEISQVVPIPSMITSHEDPRNPFLVPNR